MFSNQEIIQPRNRESSHNFSYKLMISFLVIQYSMDEKNDKQGGAFSRESEIYQRSGQKKTSWRVPIHNRGCSLAKVLALDMSWLKQMSE